MPLSHATSANGPSAITSAGRGIANIHSRRLAVTRVAQRAAVADDRDAADPPQPARRPAVGTDRTEIGEVDQLAAPCSHQPGEREVQREQRRRRRGRDRHARAARRDFDHPRHGGPGRGDRARGVDRSRGVGRTECRGDGAPDVGEREPGHRSELAERAPVARRQALDRAPQLGRARSRAAGARDLRPLDQLLERRRRRAGAMSARSSSFGGRLRPRLTSAPVRASRQPAPSSRDRRVAALTASRIAARRPCASSSRSPAAVVPPGDVTAARSASGPDGSWASSVAEPSRVWTTSLLATSRETDEHAGFDHRLGDEEDVRRTGAGQAGDRVEHRFGDAHDDPDGSEQALREIEMLGAGVAAARDRRRAEADERRACSASPARPADRARAASRVAIVTPAAIDSTSVSGAERGQRGLERRCDVARLHRDDDDVGVGHRPRRARHDTHLRELLLERDPPLAVDLRDRQRVGFPAAVEQAADEGRAHLSATEQRDA